MGMLKHIALTTPKNRVRYAALHHSTELPKASLLSKKQIEACYLAWSLQPFKSQ